DRFGDHHRLLRTDSTPAAWARRVGSVTADGPCSALAAVQTLAASLCDIRCRLISHGRSEDAPWRFGSSLSWASPASRAISSSPAALTAAALLNRSSSRSSSNGHACSSTNPLDPTSDSFGG